MNKTTNRRPKTITEERVAFKILVTGGRDFADRRMLDQVLNKAKVRFKPTHLIHGGARGLDTMAHEWAKANGVQPVTCEANWSYYDKAAGPIRNAAMALLYPDILIAFPGGSGTANMVEQAVRHGILTYDATKLYKASRE